MISEMAEVQKLTKQVKKNYKWIVKDTNLVELLDGMFQEGIFNDNDRELVKHEPTTENKNRKFLDILFTKNKQKAFNVFFDELKDAKREDVVKRIRETEVKDGEIEQDAKREDVVTRITETQVEDEEIEQDAKREDVVKRIRETEVKDGEIEQGAKREDVVTRITETQVEDEEIEQGAKREDVVTRITETQVEDEEIEQGASGNSGQVTSYGVTPNPKLDDKFMLKVANSFSPSSLDIVATSLGLNAKREDVVTRITETQVEDEEIEQGASGNSWQVTSYGVTPNPKLDDKFMLNVANSFSPSSLDIVATSLGLSKADVDHARMANQYSPITQSHNILVKWRNKNSLHSNVLDRLLKGLEEAYDSGTDIDQNKLLKCVNDLKQ
ncbi:hypothetical protein KUTeg_020630 [Tegillarca granosa]|uniref:Death domain-containing protein n=1 Tax=Tegillarca granosa TaxID=220873 RepID=A0ABQ9E8G2_TEGGR|nr:hypothetical protein KUTeg_020630 [Tegillarca granosa]